jgi:NAD(P)-dependent dehydrogenase (short-subunit alcohol dehydrogenase family)
VKAAQLFDVSGHVALVTGAASGLGLAYAEVMAANGATVAMLDIDAAGLERAAAKLPNVETFVVDVADGDRLKATIDATAVKHGRLDAVFANAGMSAGPGYTQPSGRIENVAMELWNRVLQVNLTSVFNTLQAAAVPMKRQKRGRMIVTASIAGLQSELLCGYGYVATKAAVINLVRHAALELAPYNVMVNAIAPGPFLTNIAGGRLHREPEVVKQFESMVPLGRIAHTDEIKGLALFLASPASSYVTGTVIPIDGGATAD